MIKIAPSILSADFMNLDKELRKIEKADIVHLDIMDGNFVPNMTFGPSIVNRIHMKTRLPLSAHLMTLKPDEKWRWFRDAGCRNILFHIETADRPLELIGKMKRAGIKAGLVLNPETDPKTLLPFLGAVDSVLVMSVHPGFGGQRFIQSSLEKVRFFRQHRDRLRKKYLLEIDGGINYHTAQSALEAGADVIVVGAFLFKGGAVREKIDRLHKLKI